MEPHHYFIQSRYHIEIQLFTKQKHIILLSINKSYDITLQKLCF